MTAPVDRVVVVGAGASTLVLELLDLGFHRLVAVDIAAAALQQLRERLGTRAVEVEYVVADVCSLRLPYQVSTWHDRAVFHFLTEAERQAEYAAAAAAGVRSGGHLVLATFGPEGPEQCSGLPVVRHSTASLGDVFGRSFELTDSFERDHLTPWGAAQQFLHTVWRRSVVVG